MSADQPEDQAFVYEMGRRVRLHRLYRGLTQEQLGEQARLSRNFISILETGRHGIDVRALRRIARALDVPLPSLVSEPGEGSFPWTPAQDGAPR
jgi:XRE family aerobic/anaerobic benzoate catabolism transcriptional regulator